MTERTITIHWAKPDSLTLPPIIVTVSGDDYSMRREVSYGDDQALGQAVREALTGRILGGGWTKIEQGETQ